MALTFAYLVLYLHFLYVLAVIVPVLLIPIGARRGWRWVRSRKWRFLHLGMMAFVLVEIFIGMVCPLTWLENELLKAAGQSGYQGSFIAHWVARIMYWNAPVWIFVAIYTAFFLLILLLWRRYPPSCLNGRDERGDRGVYNRR